MNDDVGSNPPRHADLLQPAASSFISKNEVVKTHTLDHPEAIACLLVPADPELSPRLLAPDREAIAANPGELLQIQQLLEEKSRVMTQLEWTVQTEQVLGKLAQANQQSQDLKEFWRLVVTQVRHVLQADRVCIHRFYANWNGSALAESVQTPYPSMLGFLIHNHCVSSQEALQRYQKGQPSFVADIAADMLAERVTLTASSQPCEIDESTVQLLKFFQIQAQLAVPIFQDGVLWGLLVVHQCAAPRSWRSLDIQFCQHVVIQVGLAIERMQLRKQLHRLYVDLDLQVQDHAERLRQTLDFEAMLQRITDRVRDSLDETTILQTAVQELATVLRASGCQAILCDVGRAVSRIRNPLAEATETALVSNCQCGREYVAFPTHEDDWAQVDELPGLCQQLNRGQSCQFCVMQTVLMHGQKSVLSCPIFDDQGYLGNLRLYARCGHIFDDQEIRLVQQVASHCAIAVRQARLYQASQAQVKELERLHQLKDDFLSTVSHELRTPLSSIKMVTNLLKLALNHSSIEVAEARTDDLLTSKVAKYLKVLEDECDREISLVNDLLATQHLDAGVHPLSLTTVRLQDWISHIIETFDHRTGMNQQTLNSKIAADLPPIISDTFILSRILVELLNNACKYTPPDGMITVMADLVDQIPNAANTVQHSTPPTPRLIQIQVINTGVEIPAEELPRIFEPFYRIPSSDPWKRGGTGLGLSLTKKLVDYLGGRIFAESSAGQVKFVVELLAD